MTDAIPANDVVTRTRKAPGPNGKPSGGTHTGMAGRVLLWAGVLTAGILTLAPVANFISSQISDTSLAQASDETIREKLAERPPKSAPADYYETLGELALQIKPQQREASLRLMKQAVAVDPSRAFAWSNIAWLETEAAGRATPDAAKALTASMDACPLCDLGLVRWRFSFVLAHWNEMPESVRRAAFDQADILRWRGDNTEFLAAMRVKATAAGIPYDTYRNSVKTPVRTPDLGPAPAAQTGAAPETGAP
ncbi:MAG: hypothetical protein GC155_02020 [Alphaproteobacteria bacterium]|nr:hypothetical protein [Alphaproteobacteria bacterium]